MKTSPKRNDSSSELAMVAELRQQGFDAAVIFTVYSQNPLPAALFAYLANIPLRLSHCRENPYHLLTNWLPDPEPEQLTRHEVRRQLDLVSSVGCRTTDDRLSFHYTEDELCDVLRLLYELGINQEKSWLVVHPGASAASRRYPAEYFAQVADRLVRRHAVQVVFTGTKAETQLIESIRQTMHAPSWSLAGRLTVAQLGSLLALAPVLLANNTGPVHIAAAVGTPVVVLYALTNPQHTPWAVPHRVLFRDVPCKYCYKSICPHGHHECLRGVSPDAVAAAILELLAEVQTKVTRQWMSHTPLPLPCVSH